MSTLKARLVIGNMHFANLAGRGRRVVKQRSGHGWGMVKASESVLDGGNCGGWKIEDLLTHTSNMQALLDL